jgi:hypothetical protein
VPQSIREKDKQTGHSEEIKHMSPGSKSLRMGLLPDEENGKCGIAMCHAEYPNIRSPKRKRTRGGLSMMRHSVTKWKLVSRQPYNVAK